jgi:thiosulfate/3-mercaptopyruvate sulfurtransferase
VISARFIRPALIAVAVAVIASPGSAAAQSRVPLLVDASWLAQHLRDPQVVLLHVGDSDYAGAHIPGARPITEDDVVKPHDMARGDLMLELPPAAELRATFEARGVSDDSHIIVYAGKGTAVQSATRIVLTLDYLDLGHRTSLLNGGIAAWQRAGHATTAQAPPARQGRLTSRLPRPVVVDAELVKQLPQLTGHRLVDARAPVFYNGTEPTFGKSGHIPGAINIPFSSIGDTLQMIDEKRAAALFRETGVRSGETVVAYCHIGQQATLVAFAARLLGHPVVLYDGAFQDWATANRGPVEK